MRPPPMLPYSGLIERRPTVIVQARPSDKCTEVAADTQVEAVLEGDEVAVA